MLKQDWVDCEGWDLFNVWQGKETKLASELRAEAAEINEAAEARPAQPKKKRQRKKTQSGDDDVAEKPIDQTVVLGRSIQQAVENGNVDVALTIHRKQQDLNPKWKIPDQALAKLIQGLHHQQRWRDSIPLMLELVQRLPQQTIGARIKLAQIMLQVEERPRQALQLLSKLPADLPDKQRQQALAIQRAAKKEAENGAVEVYVEDW